MTKVVIIYGENDDKEHVFNTWKPLDIRNAKKVTVGDGLVFITYDMDYHFFEIDQGGKFCTIKEDSG